MRPNPILFFGVVTALAVAIHLYLWWRLVRSTARSRRNRRIGAIVIGALGCSSPERARSRHAGSPPAPSGPGCAPHSVTCARFA